jgi:hypothetical protein
MTLKLSKASEFLLFFSPILLVCVSVSISHALPGTSSRTQTGRQEQCKHRQPAQRPTECPIEFIVIIVITADT